MRIRPIIGLAACVLLAIPASLRADDFTGKYKSTNLKVEIASDNGTLSGIIQLGNSSSR